MGLTLMDIRRAVGQDLHECWVGTVDSADSESITDADLIDGDADPSMFDRAWLRVYRQTSFGVLYDETRRLWSSANSSGRGGYVPAVGVLRVTRPWTVAPTAGSQYEIHTLISPTDWDRLIDNAMLRCYALELTAIPAVDSQRLYDLSALTWLEGPDSIVGIYANSDPTNLEEIRLQPLRWWATSISPTTQGVRLHVHPEYLSTDDTLVVESYRPYGGRAWTDEGTTCPRPWLFSAVRLEAYRFLAQMSSPSVDNKRYVEAMQREGAAFSNLCNRYMQRKQRPTMFADIPR